MGRGQDNNSTGTTILYGETGPRNLVAQGVSETELAVLQAIHQLFQHDYRITNVAAQPLLGRLAQIMPNSEFALSERENKNLTTLYSTLNDLIKADLVAIVDPSGPTTYKLTSSGEALAGVAV